MFRIEPDSLQLFRDDRQAWLEQHTSLTVHLDFLGALAQRGLVEDIQRLIEVLDWKKCTRENLDHFVAPLSVAAGWGQLEAVQLLSRFIDPKHNGSGALRAAIGSQHVDIVEFLLPLSDVGVYDNEPLLMALGIGSNLNPAVIHLLTPHATGADLLAALHWLEGLGDPRWQEGVVVLDNALAKTLDDAQFAGFYPRMVEKGLDLPACRARQEKTVLHQHLPDNGAHDKPAKVRL